MLHFKSLKQQHTNNGKSNKILYRMRKYIPTPHPLHSQRNGHDSLQIDFNN